MLAVTPQIHALFTISAGSGKALVTSLLVFLLNVLIMQRSISWNPVNKSLCKCHFERGKNYRNSINSRSCPQYLPTVYIMFRYFFGDPQLHLIIDLSNGR